jgi:tetratricopeptide (TPR) repeat protein
LSDVQRAVDALEEIVELEADDPAPRKKLAEFALAAGNWQVAVEYGRQVLYVDVLDADVHRILGVAWTGLENHPRAIQEFEAALQLRPGDDGLQLAAARAHLAVGEKAEAKLHLQGILKRSPNQADAVKLLNSLE